MKIERSCKCTFLCFQRPEILIFTQEFDEEMKGNDFSFSFFKRNYNILPSQLEINRESSSQIQLIPYNYANL